MRKVVQWICYKEESWPKWLVHSKTYGVIDDAIGWLSCLIHGHEPIQDVCRNPDHDLCLWCAKVLPGQAESVLFPWFEICLDTTEAELILLSEPT